MNTEATQQAEQRAQKPTMAPAEPEEMEEGEKEETEGRVTSYLEEHEWPRLTAGVAAAAGAGLFVVSLLGVGPAVVAGGAGYLAYRELSGKRPQRASSRRARR